MSAERIEAGIPFEKPFAIRILRIKAKIAELIPAKSPKEPGREKKTTEPDYVVFDHSTIAAKESGVTKLRSRVRLELAVPNENILGACQKYS